MNPSTTQSGECRRVMPLLDLYADGELDPSHAADVTTHIAHCASCDETLGFALSMKASLQRTARAKASDALHQRVRGIVLAAPTQPQTSAAPVAFFGSLAAAAAVVFAVGLSSGPKPIDAADAMSMGPVGLPRPVQAAAAPVATPVADRLLDDLVATHRYPPSTEIQDPLDLPRLSKAIGVPLREPALLRDGASFAGARLHVADQRRAALLRYVLKDKSRVSYYMFNPKALPVVSMPLERQASAEHPEQPVYVGTREGLTVAATEKAGVGYAFASEMTADRVTRFVIDAVHGDGNSPARKP